MMSALLPKSAPSTSLKHKFAQSVSSDDIGSKSHPIHKSSSLQASPANYRLTSSLPPIGSSHKATESSKTVQLLDSLSPRPRVSRKAPPPLHTPRDRSTHSHLEVTPPTDRLSTRDTVRPRTADPPYTSLHLHPNTSEHTRPISNVPRSPFEAKPVSPRHHHALSSPASQVSLRQSHPRQMSLSNASDGGIPVSVDMKRLLSKPALPSLSTSTQSDSESLTRRGLSRRVPPSPRPLDHASRSFGHISEAPLSPTSLVQSTPISPITPHPSGSRTRNVLKRKTSATPRVTTPSTPTFSTYARSPDSIGSSASAPRLRREPESESRPHARLTPAGAVAHAYKEQEKRRSQLEMFYQGDQSPSGSPAPSASGSADDMREFGARGPMPYYTILGSTSGRVVAVGSPDDNAWNRSYPASGRSATMSHITGGEVKRSLSRKMSGRWKKGGAPVPPAGQMEAVFGRPSLQDRRSVSMKAKRRQSLHLSIDGFVDLNTPEASLPSAHNGSPSKTGGEAPLRTKEKEGDVMSGGKLWRLVKRISTGGLRDRYISTEAPPPVPALPKDLIGRSHQIGSSETSPPGMISRFIQSRPSMTSAVATPPRKTKHTSPVSAGGHRPSTTTRSSSPGSSDVASSRFFHRPQSTRSSSSSFFEDSRPPPLPKNYVPHHIVPPSELSRIHADLEKTPPPPQTPQKIKLRMPPRRSLSGPNEHTWPASSPMVELASLPFPPRRPHEQSSRASVSSQESGSPNIPSFSTEDAINTFGKRNHVTDSPNGSPHRTRPPISDFGAGQLVPPPIPRRSSKRGATAPATLPSSPTTALTPTIQISSEQDLTEGTLRDISKRKSSGTHSSTSTTRPRPRSNSFSTSRAASPARSPLKFRELGASTSRPALTEQEKADKWEDLLERSARAGGTLHLGAQELLSDQISIRYSNGFT